MLKASMVSLLRRRPLVQQPMRTRERASRLSRKVRSVRRFDWWDTRLEEGARCWEELLELTWLACCFESFESFASFSFSCLSLPAPLRSPHVSRKLLKCFSSLFVVISEIGGPVGLSPHRSRRVQRYFRPPPPARRSRRCLVARALRQTTTVLLLIYLSQY